MAFSIKADVQNLLSFSLSSFLESGSFRLGSGDALGTLFLGIPHAFTCGLKERLWTLTDFGHVRFPLEGNQKHNP